METIVSLAEKISAAQKFRSNPPLETKYTSIRLLIDEMAILQPDAVYLVSYDIAGNRTELTYKEFQRKVKQGAALLASIGIKSGDTVATFASNHIETVIAYFSVFYLDACLVPVNMTEDKARWEFVLKNSNAVAVLSLDEYVESALELSSKVSSVQNVVQLTGNSRLDTVCWQNNSIEYVTVVDGVYSTDSLIVYTSGTTGVPKGVVLTQLNLLTDAHVLADWNQLSSSDRMMCVLPIHHVNGLVVTLLTPMYCGGSIVLNPKFNIDVFWKRIAYEQVGVVSVVPTLLAFLLERPELYERQNVGSLSHIICGAGPLTVELGKAFESKFKIPILHGYGLSETTCYSSMLPLDLSLDEHGYWMENFGFPSIGVALPGCEMRVQDDHGNILSSGKRGEIVICGPTVMSGYFNRLDANELAFADSWFHTGDEGFYEYDSQGRAFYFITGRIKELIIRGGVNISPLEIDEILNKIPGIKCGLAVGFENFWYGEEVGAYVVPQNEVNLEADIILSELKKYLPFHKRPKAVIFGTEIPITSTGKYQRNKLKCLFESFRQIQFKDV